MASKCIQIYIYIGGVFLVCFFFGGGVGGFFQGEQELYCQPKEVKQVNPYRSH